MYIKLTHANMDTPVYMRTDEVLLVYLSRANKCTHVVVKSLSTKNESAVWPVTESPEEILNKIKTVEENCKFPRAVSPEC